MRYAYKNADPAKILEVAEHLKAAEREIQAAIRAAGGTLKVERQGKLISALKGLSHLSISLEDNFAQRCVETGMAKTFFEVPLFGCEENLVRARQWLKEKGGCA